MCLILLANSGTPISNIPLSHLRRAYVWNPHGCGIVYNHENNLIIKKGLWSFDKLLEEINQIPANSTKIIHFRFGTMGKNDAESCHPFYINDDFAFVMNGTISQGYGTRMLMGLSDTMDWNLRFLQPLFRMIPNIDIQSNDFRTLVSGPICGARTVFLKKDGSYTILNEHLEGAFWKNGIYYSNIRSLQKIPSKFAALLGANIKPKKKNLKEELKENVIPANSVI